MNKNRRKRGFKRKVKKGLKYLFCIIYYAVTSAIPVYIFAMVFSLKNSIIYSYAIAFISFIVMDIICCILEDSGNKINKYIINIKKKKKEKQEKIKKQKEDEIKHLEELVLEKDNYSKEIEQVEEEYKEFKKEIKDIKEKINFEIYKSLGKTLSKIKKIIQILKENQEEYYKIRHTLKIYFPEFRKMTCQYIEIVNANNLDDESTSEYKRLITEFNNHLDFVKGRINETDKVNLNVGIKSLIQVMETERKNGEE